MPAIVVFSPAMGKRVMVLMPDWPAVSFVQFSCLPAPSEVTTPIPVTTMVGRPLFFWLAAILLSFTGAPSAIP